MKILVLMSTYNGEKYLQEQLDSIYAQTIPVDILVRDDASSDCTQKILEKNKESGKLNWYTGKNKKPAKSFWDLLQNSPDADFYAFCDQDDYWFDTKISMALNKIKSVEDQNSPILYCSNVIVADNELNPLYDLKSGDCIFTDFAHSLIYSLAPGCTFVFNRKAREILLKYDIDNEYEIIHDWLAHKIVAMHGTVLYDKKPSMLYRQHGNNVIGANKSGLKSFIKRVRRLLGKNSSVRSESAKSLLRVYGEDLSEDKLALLDMVANYKTDRKLKKGFLRSKDFNVNKSKNFYLKWLIRLKKV